MWWHNVDYLERDGGRRDGQLLNCGFWLNDVPRLIPLCRLLGHRPVVDGTEPLRHQHGFGSRWVCCDRCGIRPTPQGTLNSEKWHIGQPYTGPWQPTASTKPLDWVTSTTNGTPPGRWPTNPTGTIGGQLVIGKAYSTSLEVKLGNRGSEQVLAANASIAPLGALYLHTENHGTWLQRRLNPTGYQSRVTGFSAHDGHLHWRVWANRDETSSDDPWWMHGSFRTGIRDIVLGPKRYSYEDIGTVEGAVLRMPHGDDYPVTLTLQRRTLTRARRRQPLEIGWTVEVRAHKGIPTKTGGRGGVTGFGVDIPEYDSGEWVPLALAAAADRMTRDRARYGYKPASEVNA